MNFCLNHTLLDLNSQGLLPTTLVLLSIKLRGIDSVQEIQSKIPVDNYYLLTPHFSTMPTYPRISGEAFRHLPDR